MADRLDETTIQKLIQDYRDGIPTQKLGHRYGLGKTSVTRLLQERGVRIRTRQRLGDDLLREAVRLYGEGWSTQRVGDYLGFHQATIWAALKKSGVQLRPRRGWQYE